MKLVLAGSHIAITGAMEHATQSVLEQAIRAREGKIVYDKSRPVEILAVGRRPAQHMIDWARSRGAVELDEAQLERLIQYGELDLDPPEAPLAPAEAVAELRGMFDGEPSPETWRDVVALVDRCEPERLEELVHYIQGHVSRWPIDASRRYWASMISFKMLPESRSWVTGDLRVAPLEWLRELSRGEDSCKMSLVRGVSLEQTGFNATSASKVFESGHLTSLRAVDTGRDLKLAKSFFKKMVASEAMRNVESLIYYPLKRGGGAELARATTFDALTHLALRATVYSSNNDSRDDVRDLFEADWISRIETLEGTLGLSTGWSRGQSLLQEDLLGEFGHRMTNLKRLILGDTSLGERVEVLDQIASLHLVAHPFPRADFPSYRGAITMLERLSARGMPALTHLDISQLMTLPSDQSASHQGSIVRQMVNLPLLKQLRELTVGPAMHETARAALAQKHPELALS